MTYLEEYGLAAQVFRGANHTLSFNIKDEVGQPYSLADCSVMFSMYLPSNPTPVLEKQGVITSIQNGSVDFKLVPLDTIDLPAMGYDFSVIVINDTNEGGAGTEYYVAKQGRIGLKVSVLKAAEEVV